MISVRATREGLIGGVTASGYKIDTHVPFVALPSVRALSRAVRVSANGRSVIAIVLDVGPWNERDDAYVFDGQRPQAETGMDTRGRQTNGAGIDLGEFVWHALAMKDNADVTWEFVA